MTFYPDTLFPLEKNFSVWKIEVNISLKNWNSETFYVKKIGENVQNRKLFHKRHLTIFTNFIDQNYFFDIVLDEKF